MGFKLYHLLGGQTEQEQPTSGCLSSQFSASTVCMGWLRFWSANCLLYKLRVYARSHKINMVFLRF